MPSIAEVASGTLVSDLSEQTLVTSTEAEVFSLAVECSNMSPGDEVTLRIKSKAGAADSLVTALAQPIAYADVADAPLVILDPVPSPHELTCTLEQTAGPGSLSFYWSLRKVV